MKKLFSLFILCLCFSAAWGHDVEVDGIYYNLNEEDKTASVTFKGDNVFSYENEYTGDVVIPETINVNGTQYQVTSLGICCFYQCSGLTSITIPSSVTSLVNSCFYECSGLISITIPNSVTNLGAYCFKGCTGLTSITIPNSVTSLGDGCFFWCSGLTSITIPNSVTSLGWACFSDCSGLESITVEDGNSVYDSRDNCNAIIQTNTNCMVAGCKNTIIPNSVTSLGVDCFYYCSGLTSITIPNSVTSLGSSCFQSCSGLTSITIPNSVTSLSYGCFCDCSSLTSITIPNSVTSLGDYCFYQCSGLTSITIPNSVTSLGEGCFDGCTGLSSIIIPISVTNVGDYCFSDAEYLIYCYQTIYDSLKEEYGERVVLCNTPSAIGNVEAETAAPTVVGYYDLSGRRLSGQQRGLNIIRYSDGTSRKVMVK